MDLRDTTDRGEYSEEPGSLKLVKLCLREMKTGSIKSAETRTRKVSAVIIIQLMKHLEMFSELFTILSTFSHGSCHDDDNMMMIMDLETK